MIADLAEMTDQGIKEIDGVDIDLYKDRVWWVVEKIGLLPEYRDEDEIEVEDEIEDDYYKVEDDFDYEIDDSKFYV